jgi:uncharacterized protein YqeY
MLIDDIKARMTRAMKEKDAVARNVLSLAASEIQMAEVRANRKLRDDEAVAIVKKLSKSNEETLAAAPNADGADALKRELAILAEFFPKSMSVDEIVTALAAQRDAIRAANNDGQATGIAMKHLKSTGATCDGADVAVAVKRVRA